MAIKTYKKGSDEKLSPNFRAREFDCPGKGCCTQTPVDENLVAFLQQIREHFGKPIIDPTGYRCPAHNAKVANAASGSLHTKGQAVDFHIDGVSPAEIAKYAENIGVLGIGLYDTDKDGHFVHIDTRTTKSFWYGHAQEYRSTFGGAPEKNESKKGDYTMEMRNLRNGDKGEDVRALQILLKGNKYDLGTSGENHDGIDGDFGGKTEAAVIAYQKAKGLEPDGVVGELTMGSLLGV